MLIRNNKLSKAALAACLSIVGSCGWAQHVDVDQQLIVRFHLPVDPMLGGAAFTTNTALLQLFADAPAAGTLAVARLFDRGQLVGTATSTAPSGNFFPAWTDASGQLDRELATVVDGRSLIDRTIDGAIYVDFSSPVQLSYVGLTVGFSLNRVVLTRTGSEAIIDSVTVTTVPEPNTGALLGLGGLSLLAWRWRRTHKASVVLRRA